MAGTFSHPRRTFHFSRIHSPWLATLIGVLSTAMITSSARSPGITFPEIQEFDPAEEDSTACRRETGDEYHKFPNESPHLTARHPEEYMNAGHPRDGGPRLLKGAAPLASVHPGEEIPHWSMNSKER